MERGSLVIREIAWRVRGSQTPKRSHEETIGDASPSVASSVLSRPSHYPLRSSHSGSFSFSLQHSPAPSSSLSSSLFHLQTCICTTWLFCAIIPSELHLQLVWVFLFLTHTWNSDSHCCQMKNEHWVCSGVVWYDVYGIPSAGVTVVDAEAGILGIFQAPLGLRPCVRHWNGLFSLLTLTGGATGDTFFLGKRRDGKGNYRVGERQHDTQRDRARASMTMTLWDDKLIGNVWGCVCCGCKGDRVISIIPLLSCLLVRWQKPSKGFQLLYF